MFYILQNEHIEVLLLLSNKKIKQKNLLIGYYSSCSALITSPPLCTHVLLLSRLIVYYTRKNEQLDQCCQQLVAMLRCTLSTMLCCTLSIVVNNHCSQLFTVNNHCSIIVDNHQQAFSINYFRLLFQQHCSNYCSLSTSNNYWSNNTHQHCQFNKCCWTLITTLFRHCSANNVASTWWIFARVHPSLEIY